VLIRYNNSEAQKGYFDEGLLIHIPNPQNTFLTAALLWLLR
jgi:hypothetical protein